MTELHAWMTVIETAADEDTIPPEILRQRTERVRSIIAQNTCGIVPEYRNGQLFLQTLCCANHRTPEFGEIIRIYRQIAETADGSYGMIWLRDDEDPQYQNAMQAFIIKRGRLVQTADPFFSPCIPEIEDGCTAPHEKETEL